LGRKGLPNSQFHVPGEQQAGSRRNQSLADDDDDCAVPRRNMSPTNPALAVPLSRPRNRNGGSPQGRPGLRDAESGPSVTRESTLRLFQWASSAAWDRASVWCQSLVREALVQVPGSRSSPQRCQAPTLRPLALCAGPMPRPFQGWHQPSREAPSATLKRGNHHTLRSCGIWIDSMTTGFSTSFDLLGACRFSTPVYST